jgi:hypothetical protein
MKDFPRKRAAGGGRPSPFEEPTGPVKLRIPLTLIEAVKTNGGAVWLAAAIREKLEREKR